MEIWFYINHQPGPSPFCLTTFLSPLPLFLSCSFSSSSFFPFSSSDPRVYLFALSFFSVLIFAIRPTILGAPRALCPSFEARDRRSYRWQRDSFVLSRRFQLIFIVYLPDQRYLEDNGPPRYIRSESYHANTEVYLLSLPASGRRGSLLSPHPRLICRRRIAWIGIAECCWLVSSRRYVRTYI